MGTQALSQGYLGPVLTPPLPILSHLQRSVSDNTLVAMDFSGHAGRVIENPREALSVALEEAHAWRKKTNHRLSLPTPCSGASLSAGGRGPASPGVGLRGFSGHFRWGWSVRGSPPRSDSPSVSLTPAIHRTQPWFHGRISREESQRLIAQQGLVDG